ncbi:L-lysine 6-oxidase [Marinomonas spartinae]|uniref:CTQ-dependent lysine 6-oxidase LodA n=1 Tax=Marinomonas spartinae TaxID=1792290 RepID=UPI000808C20A|nr:CTQ-dependent lysine 6-oxidase LodA [Marinomonas spartinae]SBS29574.1 L-lysine 6-oxidase [Marinomonas spartinae]
MTLSIHPSVGVARLGNAEGNNFVLNPTKIGGLPHEHDENMQPTTEVINFKDEAGRIRRQGQVFKVFDESGEELTLQSPNVERIEWTVHLANKKAAWYDFNELNGNLLYGEENSYRNRKTELRNPSVGCNIDDVERQKLIIDLGPRTVSGSAESMASHPVIKAEFDISSIPDDYYTKDKYGANVKEEDRYFPPLDVKQGEDFKSLGTLIMNKHGHLIVLGGYGRAGGNTDLEGYGGGNDWFDDISDGPVSCIVTFKGGSKSDPVKAWVVVGSPDFAPEIVNISTLNDTFFDVGVRNFNLAPDIYDLEKYKNRYDQDGYHYNKNGYDKDGYDSDGCNDSGYNKNGYQKGFNENYIANYERDILPIIQRISQYQWVANVQSMSGFFSYQFDYRDNSEARKPERMKYYNYFRQLDKKVIGDYDQPQQQLISGDSDGNRFPMMPLNSGSNSVKSANAYDLTNNVVEKFLALDATQMFLLKQWAEGKFSVGDCQAFPVNPMDAASIGNCVGLPMCPGIEVTWSLQNPALYEDAYKIKHYKSIDDYAETGLSPGRDECEGGGCEPGDLTKRMACPWQADFFNCTVQTINFNEPKVNKATQTETSRTFKETDVQWSGLPEGVNVSPVITASATKEVGKNDSKPLPPNYYSYWWPPQSPWDVLTGEMDAKGQLLSHFPAGQQINYARGINSYGQMVEHWSALAFIRDQNSKNEGFPYFTESERNHELFEYREIGVGQISGNPKDNETTLPVLFINDKKVPFGTVKDELRDISSGETEKGRNMAKYLEERAFKPVRSTNILPRSGTRARG